MRVQTVDILVIADCSGHVPYRINNRQARKLIELKPGKESQF